MKPLAKHNQGFALAFSLVFLFLIVAFVQVYILVATSGFTIANRTADLKRAYYAADAGLAEAFMQLRGYASPPANFTVTNNSYAVGSKNASYSVTAGTNGASWPTFTMTSTGTYNNVSKTLQLIVQQTSASKFAYLSNSEVHPTYGNLWWVTGMTTVGPVHTNGRFNIYGDPVFEGAVSQVSPTINYYNGGPPNDNPDFQAGVTLGAPSQSVFNNTVLNNINSAAAAAGGLSLTGNSTIRFLSDGTINVTNSAKGWTNYNMAMPANKAIYVSGGNATVNGVVKGQVSVGSSNNVYINGHLTYNTDPTTNPSSTDLLALVASQNITVTTSAPNNIQLFAVMVAINGSFNVDQFWSGIRGNMVQYGGLINNVSGPTGVFDPATGVLSAGYMQLQYYDERLKTLIPPWFPPAVDAAGRTVYAKVSFKEL